MSTPAKLVRAAYPKAYATFEPATGIYRVRVSPLEPELGAGASLRSAWHHAAVSLGLKG